MANLSTVLTIDIGSDTIKMAEFSCVPGSKLVLEKFAFEPIFVGNEDPVVVFARIYQYMIQAYDFKSHDVRVTVSGQLAFSRLNKLPELSGDDDAIARVIEFEAKQAVPYTMDEIIWDYQLIQHELPAVTEFDDPAYEYEALFIAVKKDIVSSYTDVIMESGKNILSVNISPIAMTNSFQSCGQHDADACEMILNIGGQSSVLVINEGGRVFVRSIPIAGNAITQQISKEFGITFDEAEDLKRKHGFVALGGAYEEPESEVAATISKIARNVMTRLHGEISRSINVWRSQYNGNKPTKLFIAGGGSLIQYITEFFEEKLHIPVDYLNVFSIMGIADTVNKDQLLDVAPMFSELAGMGLRNCFETPIDINLLPDTIKTQKEIQAKKAYFYMSAFTIVFSILIFLSAVVMLRKFDEQRLARVGDSVMAAEELSKQVKRANSEVEGLKRTYLSLANLIMDRGRWGEIYNELATIMPDNMWITSIEGVASIENDIISLGADTNRASNEMSNGGGFGGNRFNRQPSQKPMPNGPEGMQDPSMMGGESYSQVVVSKDITAIKVKAYGLLLDQSIGTIWNKALNSNIRRSTLFVHDKPEDVVIRDVTQGEEKDNVLGFTMYLKLKKPIKMD
jgi:type IV pilus assembly protein PilM